MEKNRRIASSRHFQTYFRMSIDPDAISQAELRKVLDRPGDADNLAAILREAVNRSQRDGSTRAKAWLETLNAHADEIPIDAAEDFLRGVFSVADELNVDSDQARGWSIGDNLLRIHWLLRSLLNDRTTLEERSSILLSAARSASLTWLGSLTASAWEDHHPREGKQRETEDKCLLTEADADVARALFLERVSTAADDGSLINTSDFMRPVYLWLALIEDNGPVREWMADRIEEDASLVLLARELTSHSWGQSSDDLVSIRSDRASVQGLDRLMDLEGFRSKLKSLQARLKVESEDAATVGRFLKAWEYRDQHGDW